MSNLSRRDFLTLSAGAGIGAAAIGLAGCSTKKETAEAEDPAATFDVMNDWLPIGSIVHTSASQDLDIMIVAQKPTVTTEQMSQCDYGGVFFPIGLYGYDLSDGITEATQSIYFSKSSIEQVKFVGYRDELGDIYTEALKTSPIGKRNINVAIDVFESYFGKDISTE